MSLRTSFKFYESKCVSKHIYAILPFYFSLLPLSCIYNSLDKSIHTISGIKTLVSSSGEGRTLLCLHGWGGSHESFTELREAMRNDNVRIIAPDLPGFGESDDPEFSWSVDDYANFIEELVKELNLSNVLLIGHSFGGRISIKLASRKCEWIDHLYLCASAGLKNREYIKKKIGAWLACIGNAIFSLPVLKSIKSFARKVLYKLLRVHDYEETSGIMRETMMKVIEEDLEGLLDTISQPTDIFWGTKDKITALRDGKIMNKKIVQSNLYTYRGTRHGVHRDRASEIAEIIRKQL